MARVAASRIVFPTAIRPWHWRMAPRLTLSASSTASASSFEPGHEPGHDLRVGEEDRVGVDGRELLVRDAEGGRRTARACARPPSRPAARDTTASASGTRPTACPSPATIDAVRGDAEQRIRREAALVELARRDPDLVVVRGAGADVAAGRREMAHGEEIVGDLDDLLPRFGVRAHATARSPGQRPPRSTRPGRRPAGTPRSTTAAPLT